MKRFGIALVVGILMMIPATTALAGGNDVIREGSCAGQSDWKLKLSPEDGGIEVEFEVDQNVSGDRWRVKIRHDGDLAFRVQLRPGDHLGEVCDELNLLIDELNENPPAGATTRLMRACEDPAERAAAAAADNAVEPLVSAADRT